MNLPVVSGCDALSLRRLWDFGGIIAAIQAFLRPVLVVDSKNCLPVTLALPQLNPQRYSVARCEALPATSLSEGNARANQIAMRGTAARPAGA